VGGALVPIGVCSTIGPLVLLGIALIVFGVISFVVWLLACSQDNGLQCVANDMVHIVCAGGGRSCSSCDPGEDIRRRAVLSSNVGSSSALGRCLLG
jgi:hypothetical protein